MNHNFKINYNGDDPRTLKREFEEVLKATRALGEAIEQVTVHGRNYQTLPKSDEAFNLDRDQKIYMLNRLHAFREWAEAGAIRIISQTKED